MVHASRAGRWAAALDHYRSSRLRRSSACKATPTIKTVDDGGRETVGTRINRNNLGRDVLKPAAGRAGVPWATLHTFRHTCASLLFASGKNPRQVQEWLGHHDAAFTMRTYVHLLEEGVGDAAFFDAILQPGAGADGPSEAHDQKPSEDRRAPVGASR